MNDRKEDFPKRKLNCETFWKSVRFWICKKTVAIRQHSD